MEVAGSFYKFEALYQKLVDLRNSLAEEMQSIILKPVAFCLQNKMRKQSDLKSPFDKAWKDYHDSYSELEKNERKDAKKLGKVHIFGKVKLRFFNLSVLKS